MAATAALTEQDKQVLTALAETAQRRREQTVEVSFSSEAGTHDDSPPASGG